jgi:hypothetical protein
MISRFISNRNVKLKLKNSITQLVHYLYHGFGITRQEIESQLYWKFKTRERHLKYDPSRSNLEVYVGYFTYYALLDLVCECKRCKDKCREIPLSQLPHGDSVSTMGRPANNLEIDGLIDYETPQDVTMGKELMELAKKYFSKTDLAVLLEASDRHAEADRLGINYNTYCRRLQRRVNKFRFFLQNIGYLDG